MAGESKEELAQLEALIKKVEDSTKKPDCDGPVENSRATLIKTLQDGAGEVYERPNNGDEVTVTVAQDSAAETPTAATTYILGEGTDDFPLGVSHAIREMLKGEQSIFDIKDEHGNSLGEFTILLSKILRPLDVSGDRGVLKRVRKFGDGDKPNGGDVLTARIRGRCQGEVFDDRFEPPVTFTLDDYGEESTVFDETMFSILRTMRKGELCSCSVTPMYGDGINPDILAKKANLQYEIELVDIQSGADISDLTPMQRLKRGYSLKDNGTQFFKQKDYERAVLTYSEVLTVLEQDVIFPPELKEESRGLKMLVTLNIAACQLKLGQYQDVVGICSKVLSVNPDLVKAYYRRGVAQTKLGEHTLARKDFSRALEISPDDKGIAKALKECEAAIKDVDAKDKAMFQRMFK